MDTDVHRDRRACEAVHVEAGVSKIPLLIIDDLWMRKLPGNAAEDLLEIVMRRYERASTILTSNRPLEDWPKLFGDTPVMANPNNFTNPSVGTGCGKISSPCRR
ncbi:hypothetical protein EPN44_10870 [bacterium]|nr:MAG: hypothetical protein EPN44_10870 [bacterium]